MLLLLMLKMMLARGRRQRLQLQRLRLRQRLIRMQRVRPPCEDRLADLHQRRLRLHRP